MPRKQIRTLVACFVVSAVLVAYPIYVIRPFRAQGARELDVALWMMRVRPWATVLCSVAALAALVRDWRAVRRMRARIMTAVAAGLVCALAVLARVNVYELMFHPIGLPSFTAASQVKLDQDEKVIAVKIDGMARAYPVRGLAYHHIANDMLGKTAVVATY